MFLHTYRETHRSKSRVEPLVAFGQVESGDELTAVSVEDEMAGDSSGKQSGTTSGNDIDSTRVDAAPPVVESQHMRWNRVLRRRDSPVTVLGYGWLPCCLLYRWPWRLVSIVIINCSGDGGISCR